MNEDAGKMLLAAIEALHEDIRALRKEAREDREAREELAIKKSADAERQARYRERLKSQERHVTSRDNHVTPEVVEEALKLESTKSIKPPALRNGHVTSRNADTGPTWVAFSEAYRQRYGAEPTRNATTNAQMAQFVKRIGVEEAPQVAAFFVAHSQSFYVQKLHQVGLLLKDAEALRTQWVTGRKVTGTAAKQADQTQANYDSWMALRKGAANGME